MMIIIIVTITIITAIIICAIIQNIVILSLAVGSFSYRRLQKRAKLSQGCLPLLHSW